MKNLLESLESRRLMAAFTVTNALDSGAGSLRAAITSANATTAADVINFNMVGGTTINLTTALPIITQPLTIDATTQVGYAGSPLILLNGAAVPAGGNGLIVQASNTLIKGLMIGNFNDNAGSGGVGIAINGANVGNVTIEGCWIGTGINTSMPNNRGIVSLVGGTTVRNSVISANESTGVRFNGGSSLLVDSIVGLRPPGGSGSAGNGGAGVLIDAGVFNKVEDSVISGNSGRGIEVVSPATGVTVDGNIIGMNADRTSLIRNTTGAIFFDGATGVIKNNRIANDFASITIRIRNSNAVSIEANNIGFGANLASDFGNGTAIELDNVDNSTIRLNQIGNHTIGIKLIDSNANSIRYNGIGTLLDNATDIGNDQKGIHLVNSFDNQIGTDAEGNAISFNGAEGVHIESGERNPILGNRFRNNGGLDIDLGNIGTTWNDLNDADTGANTLLNTINPVWGAYNVPGNNGQTTISLRATNEFPGARTYRVDFYRSDAFKGPSNIGEGSLHLGSDTITYSSGPVELLFYVNIPLEIDGTYIAATVTSLDNGVPVNTSEFSEAMRVQGAPQILSSTFNFEQAHQVEFKFSRSVAASIVPSDVSVMNLATSQIYFPDGFTNKADNVVVWHFNAPLPDGNYRATLRRETVNANVPIGPTNLTLNAAGPNTINFHVLAGDANRDKVVNFDDLLILAQNYGTTGKTFSQGNFNYDGGGQVNFDDLLLLAQRYGTSVFSALPIVTKPNASGRPTRGPAFADLPKTA